MRIRVQAIVLAKQGRTAEEIAESLDASRRPVQEWVRRYNKRAWRDFSIDPDKDGARSCHRRNATGFVRGSKPVRAGKIRCAPFGDGISSVFSGKNSASSIA